MRESWARSEVAVPTTVQGGGIGVPLATGQHPRWLRRHTMWVPRVPAPYALRGNRGLVAHPLSEGTRLP
jgi:hypothetical protein